MDVGGPESMVLITPGASVKVNEIRSAEAIEPHMALRLRVVGGGCAGFSYDLYFDEATEVENQFLQNHQRQSRFLISFLFLVSRFPIVWCLVFGVLCFVVVLLLFAFCLLTFLLVFQFHCLLFF